MVSAMRGRIAWGAGLGPLSASGRSPQLQWVVVVAVVGCLLGAVASAPLTSTFAPRAAVAGPLRLRGGVMWVGGGRQFNRTADPDAGPEALEDTFEPLRVRAEAQNRIKSLRARQGPKFQSSEVMSRCPSPSAR